MSQRFLVFPWFALCVVACGPTKDTAGEALVLEARARAASVPGASDKVRGPAAMSACAPRVPERCSVTFSTPRGSEGRAELRGSFDGWGPGLPMAERDGRWVADVELGHGSEVAYKFLLDGNDWRADPANPRRSSDVYGNSLLAVSCPPIPCTPAPNQADAGTPGGGSGGAADAGGGGGAESGSTDGGVGGGSAGETGGGSGTGPGGGTGGAGVCPPGRPLGDFREESIYFLITTRFFDGDASNNYYNRDRLELGDPTWRGDFKGLIEQLDYIHDTLGFTAIWITPVVENRSGLDYHGYHAYDFTRVDPRLESPGATFQDLICEVHKRGMRLVLDVVFNHSSNYGIRGQVHNVRAPIKYYRESGPFPSANPAHPYALHLGDYRSPNREDDDNPLAPEVFRAFDPKGEEAITCPVCGGRIAVRQGSGGYSGFRNHDPGHFFHAQVQRLDPVWYHQAGYMSGGDWESPYSLQQKHMAGDTMDLNTEHPVVKKYLIDAYKKYLDMGVDALRVDTVKHLERGNLLEYVDALKAHKPGLFVFGENLVKGTGWGTCIDGSDNGPAEIRPWWYTRTTNDPCGGSRDDSGFSVLDFSLMSTFRDNVSQGRFGGLTGVFNMDWLYGDASQLVTFIDNHDIGPQNDWKYRFAGSDQALASALNLIFLARGIPAVFYGTEVRFKAGLEIDGMDAPHANSGRAYFGDHLLPGQVDQTRAHPFVAHLKRLNQIRAASSALQKGRMEKLGENDNAFWFLRNDANRSFAVVGLSQGGGTISVGGLKGGTWRDAVTGQSRQVSEGGTLTFHVKNGSAGVYLYEGPGKIGRDGVFLR